MNKRRITDIFGLATPLGDRHPQRRWREIFPLIPFGASLRLSLFAMSNLRLNRPTSSLSAVGSPACPARADWPKPAGLWSFWKRRSRALAPLRAMAE